MSTLQRIDRFQRRHPVVGFPLAVIYKYFDDQGPYLAAIITLYAFIAIFPLLLISSSILGFFLQDDPELRDRVLNSALSQFPIVGDQLGRPEGLRGSTSAIVIGSIAATYGSLGLGQAAQNAANITWSVPRNSRTNAVLQRVRSLVLLAFAGLGILTLAVASSVLANPDVLGFVGPAYGRVARVVGFVFTSLIFIGLFRLVSARRATTRGVLPGALAASVMWQGLQLIGNSFVTNVVASAEGNQMNQTFALVLGLVAFLFIAGILTVLSLEINVVLSRKLYPRALLTPFTDNVSPTEADLKAYTGYAKSQRHKGFQSIESTFEKKPKPPPG
jgi:YihY family inner membrane protein